MGSTFTPSRIGASGAIFVAFFAFWWWAPGLLNVPGYFIPPLSQVLQSYADLYQHDRIVYQTIMTGLQVVEGFVLGALLGMLVGYILGISVAAEVVLSPYILALQIAPKVAFAPLFVLWLGFGQGPRVVTAALIVFFPIMVNVMTAVRNIDPDLINLARSFKATRAQIFWRIEFPATMPPLFAGFRIGATLAVIGVTVGEFVGGNFGLGYVLTTAAGGGQTASVFAVIVLQTMVGMLLYFAVVLTERRVLHYMPQRGLDGF